MSPARSDEGDRPALVLPEIDLRGADKWEPTNAGLIRVARDSGALGEYYEKWNEVCATFRKHKQDYQATGERIAEDDARELAKRMKALCFDEGFSGTDDWRAFLTGQCLTLRLADRPARGGEFASANVMLKATHPERLEWRKGVLAFPAELVSAFGVQTCAWLNMRLESVWRELVALAVGEPISRSGDFGLVLNCNPRPEPEPQSILLVPAANEGTIADFVGLAPSKIDHWEALRRAAETLRRYRQPLGDALSDWAVAVLTEPSPRPKGSTRKQTADNELRNLVLNEVVCALVDCGLPKAGDFGDTRVSACGIVGDVFDIGRGEDEPGKAWNAVSKAIENLLRGNLFGGLVS